MHDFELVGLSSEKVVVAAHLAFKQLMEDRLQVQGCDFLDLRVTGVSAPHEVLLHQDGPLLLLEVDLESHVTQFQGKVSVRCPTLF